MGTRKELRNLSDCNSDRQVQEMYHRKKDELVMGTGYPSHYIDAVLSQSEYDHLKGQKY